MTSPDCFHFAWLSSVSFYILFHISYPLPSTSSIYHLVPHMRNQHTILAFCQICPASGPLLVNHAMRQAKRNETTLDKLASLVHLNMILVSEVVLSALLCPYCIYVPVNLLVRVVVPMSLCPSILQSVSIAIPLERQMVVAKVWRAM